MAILVALFAAMMIGLSGFGVANPAGLIKLVNRAVDGPFMAIAIGTRIALAVLLWFAAPLARHPGVFQVLAIIALLAALMVLAIGKDRVLRMIKWVAGLPPMAQRAWMLLGLAFGGYLAWAIWPALS